MLSIISQITMLFVPRAWNESGGRHEFDSMEVSDDDELDFEDFDDFDPLDEPELCEDPLEGLEPCEDPLEDPEPCEDPDEDEDPEDEEFS